MHSSHSLEEASNKPFRGGRGGGGLGNLSPSPSTKKYCPPVQIVQCKFQEENPLEQTDAFAKQGSLYFSDTIKLGI